MRPALLLVDLQADFLNAPGLEPAATLVVRQAARLLRSARAADVPAFHVVTSIEPDGRDSMPHWKALGRFRCVRGTPGHASPPGVSPRPGETTFSKTFFSAFSAPGLDRALEEIRADTLVVAGVHLHGCVRATVLDAYQRGLDVWVAEDAVGSDDPLHAAVTRRYLEARAARFAPVGELEELLAGRGPEPLAHFSPSRLAERLFTVPVGGARGGRRGHPRGARGGGPVAPDRARGSVAAARGPRRALRGRGGAARPAGRRRARQAGLAGRGGGSPHRRARAARGLAGPAGARALRRGVGVPPRDASASSP